MTMPTYLLKVSASPDCEMPRVAILGRDIRSQPAEIAKHCLVAHRAISEDVATVAESLALADRLFPRHRSRAWARSIELEIPVFEHSVFERRDVATALNEAVHFITGDAWNFRFVPRAGRPISEAALPFEEVRYRVVLPYSDGLDSFAQAASLASTFGEQNVLKLRSARIGQDGTALRRRVLRVPRNLGSMRKYEQTYRSRPFVFFSFSGIGAFVSGAEKVIVGETGQGVLGPALLPYAGEWPFRSTHPGFLVRMGRYLSLVFGKDVPIELPQLWKTKGEVLRHLREQDLLSGWQETRSCSVRPADKHGSEACGICGGCTLRALALHSADLPTAWDKNAFSLASALAIARDGKEMRPSERHIVVRSLGTMAEFASLSGNRHGASIIEKESLLFGDSDPKTVARNIADLSRRHAAEWQGFLSALPDDGWLRGLASQL
jgi:7-cyano-7-deazaguanine synthase in queuosine biosynthesis